MDNIISGQLSIFDITQPKINDIPILLLSNQIIYIVNKGDVNTAKVLDENWLFGKSKGESYPNRGYRIQFDGGGYGVVSNDGIGDVWFLQKEFAEERAKYFLETHDVILGKDIKPISTTAYRYVRDVNKRTMTAFYCELENGMYYIKEFMTYHHIAGEKSVKKFKEQQEFKYCNVEQIEYKPEFKNMYRCTKQSDWIYAEAGYTCAIG